MHSYERLPSEWFTSRKRPRSYNYLPPMSQPVSKSFNRISDFIFPDTVHVRLHHQTSQPVFRRYRRTENYSLPVMNRNDLHRRDLIVVERVPYDELDDLDLIYREQQNQQQFYHHPEQHQQQRYPSTRSIRRRYSSIVDEGRAPINERITNGLTARSAAYRERMRDRRKRHTTDNVYHSMMKSMLEEEYDDADDDETVQMNLGQPNYILSYTTTLDPITDSESLASIHQQRPISSSQYQTHISSNEFQRHNLPIRVPVNGIIQPLTPERERERPRQRQRSSSLSSRDSSSDTDITERHPTAMKFSDYQHDSSLITSSKGPPATNVPRPAVWERLQSDPIGLRHEPDIFIPIDATDTNNQETMAFTDQQITTAPIKMINDDQINNSSAHHVSLCVNDLRTTLYIDEDALNATKTTMNSNSSSGKAVIKTFIDRIIKRLQHFKRSLDSGLINVRKRNNFVNGPIISADYRSYSETTTRRRQEPDRYHDHVEHQQTSWTPSLNTQEEVKFVRPYFLIRPQSVLLLPNEIAKFKCCFGGDPLPNIVWSHNDSRIPEIHAAGGPLSIHYRTHKLHDIYYMDIGPVTLRDNGQIKCTIMNRYGREEAIAQLIVVPSASEATPVITESLADITIIEGRPLKLSCNITGLQVTVNWFHNGKLISPMTQSKTDYQGENSIFSLSQCMRTDAGTIDCLVKNRFGEARTSCRVDVVNDPEFDR